MLVRSTKHTKVALDEQEVQEAIAEFIEKKYPELKVVKGNIMFTIDVHEEDKLKGAELIIVEKH